jgi:hypothetical protein
MKTDIELEQIGKELVEKYGDDLPNPEHEPIRFAHHLKMFLYYKEREQSLG